MQRRTVAKPGRLTVATLAVVAARAAASAQIPAAGTSNLNLYRNELDEMSLEELLELRETLLDAKHNLTYYIEENDSESDDIGDMLGFGGADDFGDGGLDDQEDELDFDEDEEDGVFDDAEEEEDGIDVDEDDSEQKAKDEKEPPKKQHKTAETLFKLRQELIQEIKDQMLHKS